MTAWIVSIHFKITPIPKLKILVHMMFSSIQSEAFNIKKTFQSGILILYHLLL